jgi:mycofactocin precursor
VIRFGIMDKNPTVAEAQAADSAVEEELLIEEISIDGMCGVY